MGEMENMYTVHCMCADLNNAAALRHTPTHPNAHTNTLMLSYRSHTHTHMNLLNFT